MIFQSTIETKTLKFRVKFRSEKKSLKSLKICDFRPYRSRGDGIRDGPLEEQSSFFYQGRYVPSEGSFDTLGGNVRSGTPRALWRAASTRVSAGGPEWWFIPDDVHCFKKTVRIKFIYWLLSMRFWRKSSRMEVQSTSMKVGKKSIKLKLGFLLRPKLEFVPPNEAQVEPHGIK